MMRRVLNVKVNHFGIFRPLKVQVLRLSCPRRLKNCHCSLIKRYYTKSYLGQKGEFTKPGCTIIYTKCNLLKRIDKNRNSKYHMYKIKLIYVAS